MKKQYGYKVARYVGNTYYFSIMAKGKYRLTYRENETTECQPETKCLMVFDTVDNAELFIHKCLISLDDVAILKVEIHSRIREKFPYNPCPGQDTIEQYWHDMHLKKKSLWDDPHKKFWPEGTILCKAVTPIEEIKRYKEK